MLVPAFILGCVQSPSEGPTSVVPSDEKAIPTLHTAENSLDWEGIYEGIFPCADCEGINVRLILNYDHTYILEESYIENGSVVRTQEYEGSFHFDETNPAHIRLDSNADQRVFFIGENFAQARDRETGEPLSEVSTYILNKISEQ